MDSIPGYDAWITREPPECAERPEAATCRACGGAGVLYLEGPHAAGCHGHCDVCVEWQCDRCEGRGELCPECAAPGDGDDCGCLGAEFAEGRP